MADLSTKEAIAIARAYKIELNRRVASLARIEDVLTKANEVGNLSHEFDEKQAKMALFEAEAEKKRADIEQQAKELKDQRNTEIRRLDLDIRGKEAQVKRLMDQANKLTAIIGIAEDETEAKVEETAHG